MKPEELKNKIIVQLRMYGHSGKDEGTTADHIIQIVQSNFWTSSCDCPNDEKTGETLCCNLCGRPTARTSEELPGDDEINEYAKIKCDKFYGKGNQDDFSDSILFYNFGMQQMRSIASPLLASKDARIRELEEANKLAEIKIAELIELNLTPPKN